jgi:hypothetical protein
MGLYIIMYTVRCSCGTQRVEQVMQRLHAVRFQLKCVRITFMIFQRCPLPSPKIKVPDINCLR